MQSYVDVSAAALWFNLGNMSCVQRCQPVLASCRLPELTRVKEKEHSSPSPYHIQPELPQPPHSTSSSQHIQSEQQPAQKLAEDSRSFAAAAKDSNAALAALSQLHTEHQSDRQHNKAVHAHFADDDGDVSSAQDGTERNESITAVRGAAAGQGGSHAAGIFWQGLDAEGTSTTGQAPMFAQRVLHA